MTTGTKEEDLQTTTPINAEDISEYLASTDDFAFEREVYSIAKGLGFDAQHAALYIDPVTGKPRQFDVRASITVGQDRVALAVECKSISLDFPLVVSCVPRERNESLHEILCRDGVMGAGVVERQVPRMGGYMTRLFNRERKHRGVTPTTR